MICPECGSDATSELCTFCGARMPAPAPKLRPQRPCPRCAVETIAEIVARTPVRRCPQCDGLWLAIADVRALTADRARLGEVLWTDPGSGDVPTPARKPAFCPECGAILELARFGNGGPTVDRCASHGIWFDRHELRELARMLLATGARSSDPREFYRTVGDAVADVLAAFLKL